MAERLTLCAEIERKVFQSLVMQAVELTCSHVCSYKTNTNCGMVKDNTYVGYYKVRF